MVAKGTNKRRKQYIRKGKSRTERVLLPRAEMFEKKGK